MCVCNETIIVLIKTASFCLLHEFHIFYQKKQSLTNLLIFFFLSRIKQKQDQVLFLLKRWCNEQHLRQFLLMLVIHTTRMNTLPSPSIKFESILVLSIFSMVYHHQQELNTSSTHTELIKLMETISSASLLEVMHFKNTSKWKHSSLYKIQY